VYEQYDLETTFVDTTDHDAVRDAMREETELVWVETPTNPLLNVNDIGALADIAHEADALCAVDNTFATPYLQRPLEHGADIVCQSLTKYLGGHPTPSAGRSSSTTQNWTSGSASTRTRWARRPARSTPSSCYAGRRRSRSGWTATARTRWNWLSG